MVYEAALKILFYNHMKLWAMLIFFLTESLIANILLENSVTVISEA